jgi:GNAT superfamily N-acetyltransferase
LLKVFMSGSDIGAIGYLEAPDALWLTIDPARLFDRELARVIADGALEFGWTSISAAGSPAVVRGALGAKGFRIDPDPWLHLWRPLSDADIREHPGVISSTSSESTIQQRIAVQVSAFSNSTFNREKWEQMSQGPAFRAELDLVAVNEEGIGVSALTAWFQGEDACGMIEPMGTHANHRRQGHGRRVLEASFAELRKLGASSVRVYTPRNNLAAVATYHHAGFVTIDYDTTLILS